MSLAAATCVSTVTSSNAASSQTRSRARDAILRGTVEVDGSERVEAVAEGNGRRGHRDPR